MPAGGRSRSEAVDNVLEQLDGLVGQSLLQFLDARGGGSRFTMLETIHAYARELLETCDDAATLRGKHALYYLALAERHAPFGRGRTGQVDRPAEKRA